MPDYTVHKPKVSLTLAADGTEESVPGNAEIQVKDMSFIKGVFNARTLTIEIEIKTNFNLELAICKVRHDGLGTIDLQLQTFSTTFVILSGTIDVSGFTPGRHTLEFFLENTGSSIDISTLRETWVYGRE